MSTTPRTDEQTYIPINTVDESDDENGAVVKASLARTLETELTDLERQRDEWRALFKKISRTIDDMEEDDFLSEISELGDEIKALVKKEDK